MSSAIKQSDGFGPQFLMIPGPSPVSDRVRNAMHRQSVDFSSDEFIALANRIFDDLKGIFCTDSEVFVYSSNGHGAWESALSNTLKPGDKVLLPETGLFSEAWREMAKALGIETMNIPGNWREATNTQLLAEVLAKDTDKEIKAVLIVQTDTSSSVTSDVSAIRRAIDSVGHPALLMVDAIASLCTAPLKMDEWNVDVVVAASQKALMVPPGLALVAASERAIDVSRNQNTSSYYWSWEERLKGEHYKRFCGTAPEQLIFGLGEALEMLNSEGLERVIIRHHQLAESVRACVGVWCECGELEFNAQIPSQRADSVTTVRVPDGFDAELIRQNARVDHNVIVGGGLGELRGQIFRIGHMGYINVPYVLGSLSVIDLTLKQLGIAVGKGAIEAALDVAASNY